MEVRNGKKMNFKRIYSQIAKYGRIIPELAKEYGMEEQEFIERIEMGLDPKLFSSAIKANEKNIKQRKKAVLKVAPAIITDISHEVKKDMTRRNEEKMIQNYRQNQSNKDKATQIQKKQTLLKLVTTSANMSELENQKVAVAGEIFNEEKALNEAIQILAIREKTVVETQKVLDEAKKALFESQNERDKAKYIVTQYREAIDNLKAKLKNVENQIAEIKNKVIYLVAPGYTGSKPEYGTYYSTANVTGYDTLSVVESTAEYAIEPELKDMVVAGYDSYKEYMEGLRFTMLCVEYTCKGIDYTVLVTDERLKRLLKTHVG